MKPMKDDRFRKCRFCQGWFVPRPHLTDYCCTACQRADNLYSNRKQMKEHETQNAAEPKRNKCDVMQVCQYCVRIWYGPPPRKTYCSDACRQLAGEV